MLTTQLGMQVGPASPPGSPPRRRIPKIGNPRFWIILIIFGVIPTGIWIWQMSSVLDFLSNVGASLPIPLGSFTLRWIPILLLFAYALNRGSYYAEMRITLAGPAYPPLGHAITEGLIFYISFIFIPFLIVKPLVEAGVVAILEQPGIKQFILGWNVMAEKIGFLPKIDVPITSEKEKSLEDKLCGGYMRFDEEGVETKGDKVVDMVIDAPSWEESGSTYRAKIVLNNLGKEPINVIVLKGDSTGLTLKTSEKAIRFYTDKPQVGTYISGKETPEDEKKTTDAYYILTPLNCLEPKGCRLEPGLEKTVELISSSKVAFKSKTAASLNVELKVIYDKESGKKGIGTGHMLIFPTSTDAAARQKTSNFKSSYCPTTLAGPLDVVVIPPFYTAGGSDNGGDGYFKVNTESQCPTEDIKEFRLTKVSGKNYCLQNIKTVKIRLINTDENAHIFPKSIKTFPSKDGDSLPKEFNNTFKGFDIKGDIKGNCFLESLGEDENGLVFKDESGLTEDNLLKKVKGGFRKELTFLCRYQLCDLPPNSQFKEIDCKSTTITEFKDFQFRAEVEYDYITTFTKGGIPMLAK